MAFGIHSQKQVGIEVVEGGGSLRVDKKIRRCGVSMQPFLLEPAGIGQSGTRRHRGQLVILSKEGLKSC